MRINYAGEANSKAVWGKLSWILGLAGIFLFLLGLFAQPIMHSAGLDWFLIYLIPILIVAGLFCGFMGLFTTRAWVGLILNLLLAVIGCLFFVYLFVLCCAPPKLN
jgi:hypothetical protein